MNAALYRTCVLLSLTILSVVAFHIDAEDGDLLLLGLIVEDVDEGDGDAPGRQVPLDAWHAGRLSGGIVLHHDGRLLHLQEQMINMIIINNKLENKTVLTVFY